MKTTIPEGFYISLLLKVQHLTRDLLGVYGLFIPKIGASKEDKRGNDLTNIFVDMWLDSYDVYELEMKLRELGVYKNTHDLNNSGGYSKIIRIDLYEVTKLLTNGDK